jgi:hypothetical protein
VGAQRRVLLCEIDQPRQGEGLHDPALVPQKRKKETNRCTPLARIEFEARQNLRRVPADFRFTVHRSDSQEIARKGIKPVGARLGQLFQSVCRAHPDNDVIARKGACELR